MRPNLKAAPLTRLQQSADSPTHWVKASHTSLVSPSMSHAPIQWWVGHLQSPVYIKQDTQGMCSKHFKHFDTLTARDWVLLVHRNQTLANRHLSESSMATFVSVSFPSHQHLGLSTAWITLIDLCAGGRLCPVLPLCNSGWRVFWWGLVTEGCEECWCILMLP